MSPNSGELVDLVWYSLEVIGVLFKLLDRDKNGLVEMADLQRMQVWGRGLESGGFGGAAVTGAVGVCTSSGGRPRCYPGKPRSLDG